MCCGGFWSAPTICVVTFLFVFVVDVVTDSASVGVSELMYGDDEVFINEALEGFGLKLGEWKRAWGLRLPFWKDHSDGHWRYSKE